MDCDQGENVIDGVLGRTGQPRAGQRPLAVELDRLASINLWFQTGDPTLLGLSPLFVHWSITIWLLGFSATEQRQYIIWEELSSAWLCRRCLDANSLSSLSWDVQYSCPLPLRRWVPRLAEHLIPWESRQNAGSQVPPQTAESASLMVVAENLYWKRTAFHVFKCPLMAWLHHFFSSEFSWNFYSLK